MIEQVFFVKQEGMQGNATTCQGNITTLRCIAVELLGEGCDDPSPTVCYEADQDRHSEEHVLLDGVAALMFISGSTGVAKAVCLSHEQILAACSGKSRHMPLAGDATVLNWIGLDHVGSLTELQPTAMVAGCDQFHVPTTEVIADPLVFLRLLSKHNVRRTFAPHFLLARLGSLLSAKPAPDTRDIDLHSLHHLISGGGRNSVETCVRLSHSTSKTGRP
jgi:acyl-coenzyme A synthetase/AMP-(fatty) acid ligase